MAGFSPYAAWGNPWGQYGQDTADTPPEEDPSKVQQAWSVYQLVKDLREITQDPYKKMALAQVALDRAKAQGQPASVVAEKQAAYDSAMRQYEKSLATEQTIADFAFLGKVGLATGVGIGAAIMLFVLVKAFK